MDFGNGIFTDGPVCGAQATAPGQAVMLGDDMKIPAGFVSGGGSKLTFLQNVEPTVFIEAFDSAPDGSFVAISDIPVSSFGFCGFKTDSSLWGTGHYIIDVPDNFAVHSIDVQGDIFIVYFGPDGEESVAFDSTVSAIIITP